MSILLNSQSLFFLMCPFDQGRIKSNTFVVTLTPRVALPSNLMFDITFTLLRKTIQI